MPSISVPADAPPQGVLTAAAVSVVGGQTYVFSTTGFWYDWFIKTDAAGYVGRLAGLFNLSADVPDEPLLSLCAQWQGKNFHVGRHHVWTAPVDGSLSFFANDLVGNSWFRRNNRGAIMLTVTAIPPGTPVPAPVSPPYGVWRTLVGVLERTQGILAISALVVATLLILACLPQGRDVVTQVVDSHFSSQTGWMIATLLFVALQAWFWPRRIIEANFSPARKNWQDLRPLLIWWPRLLGVAPIVAVMAIAAFAVPPYEKEPHPLLFLTLLLLCLVFLIFVINREKLIDALRSQHSSWLEKLGLLWPVAVILASFALFVAITAFPAAVGQTLGPAAIVFAAVSGVIPTLAVLPQIASTFRVPATGALLLWAILCSPLNDGQHEVGRRAFGISAEPLDPDSRPPLEFAFQQWVANAPGAAENTPKRAIIVATEGGASRAGYWTALALDRLQLEDPLFRRQVFAISSISGGSLGVMEWVKSADVTDGKLRAGLIDQFTGADHLGPALAGNLFPDAFQRFLPTPVLPDGAETIEKGFERSWHTACQEAKCSDDRLDQSFLGLWRNLNHAPWRPLMLIGGTNEETGRRILTAPVTFSGIFDADDFYGLSHKDVMQSTAILNGARFPWVSPPGLIVRRCGNYHIVDGGYFDASGIETARELAVWIRAKHSDVQPVILILKYDEASDESSAPSKPVANDLMGPLVGLYSARVAHMQHMINAAAPPDPARLNSGVPDPQTGIVVLSVTLHANAVPLPMSWGLSDSAQAYAKSLELQDSTRSEWSRAAQVLESPVPTADTVAKPPSLPTATPMPSTATAVQSPASVDKRRTSGHRHHRHARSRR